MKKKDIEIIKKGDDILAIIIPHNYYSEGTQFFTPADFSQQLAFISRKCGQVIQAHKHNVVKRDVHLTQEVLVIKKGKVKLNFYDSKKKYFDYRILEPGDIILLASGGHGFEFLKNSQMVEVKQGPYLGEDDKTMFKGIEK